MRKLTALVVLLCIVAFTTPSHAFFDYLFGGSSSRDAIDNSALGDLRAWWTGNPAYQFNPYYTPSQAPTDQQSQGGAPDAAYGQQIGAGQAPPPTTTFYPSQQAPANPYGQPGYGGAAPAGPPQYGAPAPGYQPAPQQAAYPPPQQAYQASPQTYQMPPQGYQAQQAQPGQQTYGGTGYVPGYGYRQ